MTESQRRDGVEDLQRQAESMHFWEEELEQIDLGTCCLIPSYAVFERLTYRLPVVTTFAREYIRGKSQYNISWTFAGCTGLLRQVQAYSTTKYYKTMNSQTLNLSTASNKWQTTNNQLDKRVKHTETEIRNQRNGTTTETVTTKLRHRK